MKILSNVMFFNVRTDMVLVVKMEEGNGILGDNEVAEINVEVLNSSLNCGKKKIRDIHDVF